MRDLKLYRTLLARPNWHTHNDTLPSHISDWLQHTASLTEKLQQICDDLQVEVITEGWQAVENSENSAKYWLREVVLKCGDCDWIFAQTQLPESTIDNVAQNVPLLGEQPIGRWLFPQQPKRLSLVWQYDSGSGLYARCSRLSLKGYPIEIKELFLTDFPFRA